MQAPTSCMSAKTPITVEEIRKHFEEDYTANAEPWDYSLSGAEMLRYKRVVEVGKLHAPKPERLLELGCSLGLFTIELAGWAKHVLALDIAPTAIVKAERRVNSIDKRGTEFSFVANSATEPVAPAQSFDVITVLDVLESVVESPHIQQQIVENIKYLLKPGGLVLGTDYTHPSRFQEVRERYEKWGFKVVEYHYMNDRLWYSMRTNLKSVKHMFPFKQFLASKTMARFMAGISARRGAKGSKHMLVVLRVA